MELECDLSAIQNEDLLRRMWQQTPDIDQKKEIRSHLYKLRESRLRDLYQGEIMAGNYAKDPLNSSHGDSLVGQNFQSLKSKEVRDSVSPINDLKFHSMTLNHPNTTGWDVQTSSEVSPDGRAYRTETLATTDGVEKINGGTAEFRGRNEQRASASHQGDDKNFVKKASESSNTHLQERVVVGDENSGRTEMKTSSTTTSSSSQVTSSSSTIEYGGADPNDGRYLMDNTQRQHQDHQRLTQDQYNQQIRQQQQLQQQEYEQNIQHQQHQQRVQQQHQEFNSNRQESSTSRNVETQQTKEQNRRVVDMDKASPEYQQHVQHLMAQPGEIISNTVEYPKPNVKMITTVKRLPDGTIVKNKRYETEELRPTVDTQRQRTTSTTSQSSTQHRNEQQRREQTEDNVYNRQQNVRNNVYSNNTPRRPEHDVVDNAEPFLRKPNPQDLAVSHPADHFVDETTNVETKFSSVKKSSRKFSTETTSETIEEFSDQPPSSQAPGIRGKPPSGHLPNKDFSTHGFPSVKPNKPTQEYPSERPHIGSQPDFSTHGFPSVKSNKPTQEYPSDRPRPSEVERITQRTVTPTNKPSTDAPHGFPAVRPNTNITTTKDGDVIIVSSESTRSSKYKTNAERVIETEVVVDGDSNVRPESYPNRGFPAVNEPLTGGRDSPRYGAPIKEYPSSPIKQSPEYSTSGFPSTKDVARPNSGQPVPSRTVDQDGNVIVVSSETKKVIKHNTNREHIIETEIAGNYDHHTPSGLRQPDKITFPPTPQPGDFSTHGFPSVRDSAPTNDAYRRQGTPTRDYPSSPRKAQPSEDFSTHGFPSVRESAPVRGSTPSRDYPSNPGQHQPKDDFSTHGFPSVRSPKKTAPDFSTPSGGFPSTRDTNAPKLTPTQPQRIQPNTTPTRKPTSTTDSSQRLISKERDVDATHRAFAASLRCSSPVDSTDHHRTTPRSSVSSTRTFRRDGREGSHDSETSRISSGTVTRSSPSKSVGKTVVTKQTVVKTRNVNGSNETIDLTPQQRPTKSPSPTKTITTTTTRTTTTRKSPGEVPKPEKSPYSPAPSNNIHRTHPKTTSPVRDDFEDVNHEEPIHKQPLSSYVIEPKQRNRSPSGPLPSGSPQTICQPNRKESSVGRRTVVRESEFENTDWQNTILDSNERPYPVKDGSSKPRENRPKDDDYIKETLVDTSDFPVIREETIKRTDQNRQKEIVAIKGTRNEKLRSNENNFVTIENDVRKPNGKEPSGPVGKKPTSAKPLDSTDRRPKERKPSDKHPIEYTEKPKSPIRKTSDFTSSNKFDTSVTTKTTRKENSNVIGDDIEPHQSIPKQPSERKPSDTGKLKPNVVDRSPIRKPTNSKTLSDITLKSVCKENDEPVDRKPTGASLKEPAFKRPTGKKPESSPTRKPEKDTSITSEDNVIKTSTITTTVTKTRKDNVSPTRPNNKTPDEDRPTKLSQQKPIYTNTLKHEPRDEYPAPTDNNPTKKIPTKENLKSTEIRVTKTQVVASTDKYQPGPKRTKPLTTEPSNSEYDDDVNESEHEQSNPLRTAPSEPEKVTPENTPNNTQEREDFSDTESTSSSFITTIIKKVRTDEPKTTHQTITDETKKVQELFNKTDKTKITKNVNEEFITFEQRKRERIPVDDTPTTKTELRNKEANKPSFEPIDNYSKPNDTDDDEQSCTNANTLKISSVRTTLRTFAQDKSHSPEYQPSDREPKLVQPSVMGLSNDDEVPQQTIESTNKNTHKANSPNFTDGGKPKSDAKQILPDHNVKDRIPSTKPTGQTFDTIISTTTTKISQNLPGEKTTAKPREASDKLVQTTFDETKKVEELFNTNKLAHTKNTIEEFITIERQNKETPDGAFISKAPEPEPSSPSFKKKGVSPRETFEDRCRQILGMENYGDTPGVYKKKPEDISELTESVTVNVTELDVQIEDCEDDESTYVNNIKDSVKPQKPQQPKTGNTLDDEILEEVECVPKETVVPFKRSSPDTEPLTEICRKTTLISETDLNKEEDEQTVSKKSSKIVTKTSSPSPKKVKSQNEEPEDSSTTDSEFPEKETDEESQPDTIVSKRDMQYTEEVENVSNVVEVTKKQVTKEKPSSPNKSPTRKPSEPQVTRKISPVRQHPSGSSTITELKTIETKTKSREPNKPSKIKSETKLVDKSAEKPDNQSIVGRDKPTSTAKLRSERINKVDTDKGHQKPTKESPTHTIKDRLRSATRNNKPSESQSDSSPDVSPSRFTERRRSSNISVHTEIIIDHSGPKSPKPIEKSPEKHAPQTKKTSSADKTSPNTRPVRRLPVTERKESAPVPSVTRKEKDAKMTRSTSEKVMKITDKPLKETVVNTLAPSPTPKGDRRPNKCFTTKTINLTTTDKLINSEEMENVIIDIQHAKSSREPSPNKIVPTPVPVHLDTGRPRYPDVVQEPEDEPRKKPVITNIPIFEEESNEYIKCHISEVKTDKISKLEGLDENDILDNPMIEAPKSLDYPSIDRLDDDCLLSVHEKVSKFTHTAEEIKKPKASSPFSREFDKTPKVPENDECLLTVDEKVNKFIKTAEEVAKPITPIREVERPTYTDLAEELRTDDCTLSVSQKVNKFLSTAEKLAPTAPQRSPELVAKIERTISKQSEPEYPEDLSDDELTPFSQNHTLEIEKRRQKDILSRPTVFENTTKTDQYSDYSEVKLTTTKNNTSLEEHEEVIPHTRDHTTKLELKRQKDILSRPSINNQNVKGRPQSPNKKEPTGPSKHPLTNVKTKQMEYTTRKINREDSDKIEIKAERKPSTPVSKPDSRRTTIPQASSVAVTRSRFETTDMKRKIPKSSVEPKAKIITGRKPTSEPKTSGRKPSTESITHSSYPSRGKPKTELDSQFDGRKPSTEFEINVHDSEAVESETEFTSTSRRRSSSKTKDYLETVQTEIERFSPTQKESPTRKTFLMEKKTPQTFSHSPIRKDTTSTTNVIHVTERTNKHNSDCSDIEIVETVIERPSHVKTPTPTPTTVGRTRITSDTVAARRNIFETNTTPKGQSPGESNSPSPVGRRPSYMDHTVSSLEHSRRDSLEVNKHNYSRKSSVDSEINYERRPNTAVKFDVPHKPQRTASIPEDIDVENIFELEVLERLLETVTSYELRRRIRAQIRLVKKNTLNTNVVDKRKTETKASNSIRSTHKTSTYKSNVHQEETDTINEVVTTKVPYDNKGSPKHPVQTPKMGRATQNAPRKSPYGTEESPRSHNKLHSEQNVTTKSTYDTKTANGRTESPERPRKLPFERDHSPETKTSHEQVKEIRRISGSSKSSHKEYVHSEQTDYSEENIKSSRRHVEQSSERFEKDHSRERNSSPESKSPVRDGRHSQDIKIKTLPSTRIRSPDDRKSSSQRTISPKGRTPKQRDELYNISKVTTVKTTRSPERKSSKPNVDENVPIWADRKNLLKSPSNAPRKVTTTPSTRNTATKVTTSKTTSQRQTQNRNFEEDSITSSYGIGPTDENGLPLFGIKALKKKKPSQPCEATEEVTGYVIEEKYYSDSKTKPKVERKEYIYSTNADELEEITKTLEQSRKSSEDNVDVIRKVEKLDKDYIFDKPEAIMPDTEDFTTTSSKYVRRGSVKELSEKFIRKESSQSVTEKSGGYPKAGLILRTRRGSSSEPSGDGYEITTEKYSTTSSSHVRRDDSDDEQNVQLRQKQTRRILTDYDDNDADQCHLSNRSSTKSTRSFLNSGETKVVTSVDDALERMRNADYVVEEGDTAEDREARSLLNKFLGASVIMKGVESVLPTTKQTTTTTITKTSYGDGDDGDRDLLKNKAVKTTRITKTTKSGSSSTPVTRTTCDIEEIWDEEILKELLEQATTYEERRKIRARLRDLMAEREEKKYLKSGDISENVPEVDESSASEYEEIIEEVTVTDYSDAEADLGEEEVFKSSQNIASETKETTDNIEKKGEQAENFDKEKVTSVTENVKEEKVKQVTKEIEKVNLKAKESVVTKETNEEADVATDSKNSNSNEETVAESSVDKTDSKSVDDDKGESLVPLLQDILQKSLPNAIANARNFQERAPNAELNLPAITSTRTNKGCSSSSIKISEHSDLCTVNNCNNNNNTTNNNEDSKNHTDHTNVNHTHSDPNIKPARADCTNSDQTLDSNSSETTMTRDIVMPKRTGNSVSASQQKQLDRLSVPQKEDSGTESGEDLRLIAAGLRDSLQLQSDSNLIEEVTTALTRLELSLKEGKNIPVDGSKREALLALVARLQNGLTSRDAAVNLSNMADNGGQFDETSSPEGDGQRANRQRFARRRNRNSRHTVGVSREELADARRYMEDMQLMDNISNCTTPESGMTANPLTPPQWFPIEKNPSSGAIVTNSSSSTLYRPNQFVPNQLKNSIECLNGDAHRTLRENDGQKSKRPLSGNFSVSFKPNPTSNDPEPFVNDNQEEQKEFHVNGNISPDSVYKSNRFSSKRQLMKRANTIDIPKTKKYNPDFDTDSEQEEKTPQLGLKRTLQVNVKHKVRNAVPPFVPKTENDHKFLAFINKQSAKPGLGWTGSRSVSNWTNKFGNLKHTFEVGAAAQVTTGKPPQAPGHVPHSASKSYWQKQVANQEHNQHQQQQQQQYLQYQQQQRQQQQQLAYQHQLQRSQHEENERLRRMERERLEREHIERDRQERQRLERERQERDRLEREFYEREIMERERLAAAQHAAMPSMTVPKPAPVNKFQHAPQSVFRPIENNDAHGHNIFKPIPQLPQKSNTWQPPSITKKPHSAPVQSTSASPQFLTTKPSVNGAHVTSPSSTTSSPIGLPWVAKPAVDNSDFRKKAHTFEERSQNDNHQHSYLQRHHSLRSPKVSQPQMNEYKKRPSLPNAADPYTAAQSQYVPQQQQPSQVYASTTNIYAAPPPPTNISFTYADLARTNNYKSYPCLPSAVETSITAEYVRQRESSLTDPHATPLVLTSSNPTYEPPAENQVFYNDAPSPRQFDYASPIDSAPTSPSILAMPPTDYTDDDLDSDNLMEYRAETRVMGKPQSQTAVTIRDRRTAHASDDEVFGKNSRSAQSLLQTMRNVGKSGSNITKVKKDPVRKVESPKVCLSPDGRSYQAPVVEPLFPQVTNFEPNRIPEYIQNPTKAAAQSKQKKPRPKTPPKPSQQMDRSLQLARTEQKHRFEQQSNMDRTKYSNENEAPAQQQKVQYQTVSVSNTSSTNSVPYTSETQTAYTVTYPTEAIHENPYAKQQPNALPLQRNRNSTENLSTISSMSHNLPSPGTSWTPNPIHSVDEILSQPKQSKKTVDVQSLQSNTYNPHPFVATQTQPMSQSNLQGSAQPKPQVAPKPAVKGVQTAPLSESHPNYQPQYVHTPSQKPPPQAPLQTKLPAQERLQQPPLQITQPRAKPTPKLTTRSQTLSSSSQSQTSEQHYAYQPIQPVSKTRAFDAAMTPLKTQNRVLSQQSLISNKQHQFDHKQEQQLQLNDLRRKSLGNVYDVQQQQRKAAYMSETKTIVKQEYKSSAPADTPDIVKSSLPKEDMPILKKFGPPQRHHYMPNSYQSPTANTQTKKFESSTKVIKNTKHQIVQHSTLTKKPSIVEIPATPQPDEDLIPRNIVFNNISAFTSMSRRQEDHEHSHFNAHPRTNRLSKSDSWNQIVQMQNQANIQQPATSPKFGNSGSELRRTKSGHTLNVRMYEAGIDKTEVGEKQRTVAAYFTGKKSPNQLGGGEAVEMRSAITNATMSTAATGAKKSTINRHRTSEKISASRKSLTAVTSNGMPAPAPTILGGGLTRSATMPHIASLNLLDESNVEDAFEQLMMGS
ncbi:PREDICTED: uncharacterized protein LOC108975828 isoform X3 [Bactrocera latifrons]|uniref:uncharacterized protein LOC108975828 isoform X3 n=1 Tax=Bactrocera latifrons TaxID=174628 RepID=UPI0008DCD59E|nr:PREDICTED: uncharacterized protein LOC108975828 isoform X3 [Bactrocera latifrons]